MKFNVILSKRTEYPLDPPILTVVEDYEIDNEGNLNAFLFNEGILVAASDMVEIDVKEYSQENVTPLLVQSIKKQQKNLQAKFLEEQKKLDDNLQTILCLN